MNNSIAPALFLSIALAGLLLGAPRAEADTLVAPGTNTLGTAIAGPGAYTLEAGAHVISANVTLPANVTLTAEPGATLTLDNASLALQSTTTLSGLTIFMTGSAEVLAYIASDHTFNRDITIEDSHLSGGRFRIGQGFNNYNRNITVTGNTFDDAVLYVEVVKNMLISGNTFMVASGKRPLQVSGSQITIADNRISGGTTGILFLGRTDLNSWRVPVQENKIINNVIDHVSEEAISFDLNGNNGNSSSVREYDTVSAAPGSNQVVMSSVNWTTQTKYGGSTYHAAFVSGALAGKYYLITTESGPTLTLSIPEAEHAQIAPGDGIVISTIASGNVIANNVAADVTTGVMFWGRGHENTVANNVIITNDAGGHGITFASLNGINSTGSISALPRRAPSANNAALNNIVVRGLLEPSYYHNYGGAADYPVIASSLTGTIAADPSFAAADGDYALRADSPAIDAGVAVSGRATDFAGNPLYGMPDIGAYEYQPPYSMGTDPLNLSGDVRVYGDGKYRYSSATTTDVSMDFTAFPAGGSFADFGPTDARPTWLDVSDVVWNLSEPYSKEWTASSTSAGAVTFTIGAMEPSAYYLLSVDGTARETLQADGDGRISYTYNEGWTAPHTFNVGPTIAAASIASDNVSPSVAKPGDTVTVSFSSNSVPLSVPDGTIAGRPALVLANGDGTGTTTATAWTASVVMQESDAGGLIPFSLQVGNDQGIGTTTIASPLAGSHVRFYASAPIISLVGGNPDSVRRGASAEYADPGATAVDSNGDAVSVSVEGSVRMSVAGRYVLTYTAADAAGNSATATRIVRVISADSGGSSPRPPRADEDGEDATIYPPATETPLAPPASTSTALLPYAFARDLTIGARGPDVSSLQAFLIGRGYPIEAGATGYFGIQTQAALAAYQRAQGIIPALGYFGPLTRASIGGSALPDSPPLPAGGPFARDLFVGLEGEDVRRLQAFLNVHGFAVAEAPQPGSPGNETSFYGVSTADAVGRFQAAYASEILAPYGLNAPTGYAGPATRAKLNSF